MGSMLSKWMVISCPTSLTPSSLLLASSVVFAAVAQSLLVDLQEQLAQAEHVLITLELKSNIVDNFDKKITLRFIFIT